MIDDSQLSSVGVNSQFPYGVRPGTIGKLTQHQVGTSQSKRTAQYHQNFGNLAA